MESKALRNQELLVHVREGQRAIEDLQLYEMGLESAIGMSQVCMLALSEELLDIDARIARRLLKNAAILIDRAEFLRCTMVEQAATDSSLLPFLNVMNSGFRMAEGNNLKLRDYPDPNMRNNWQALAVNVLQYISAIRRQANVIAAEANKARSILVEENLGLMRMVAYNSCTHDRERYDQMFSVASEQFIVCMDKTYDPACKPHVLFTTYATKCMRMRCLGAMATPHSLAHIPHGRHSLTAKVMAGELPVDASDISDPKQRQEEGGIRKRIYNLTNPIELDATASCDSDTTVGDLRLSVNDSDIDRIIDETAVIEIIGKALQKSSMAHHVVITERLGIQGGDETNTFAEIARILHRRGLTRDEVSRQRIGQIMDDVRARIRRHMEK